MTGAEGAAQAQTFMADDKPLTPRDAVAAIITANGRYLMQLRDDHGGIFYPDHWGLFGGGIEPGEEETDALVRELAEELDLEIAAQEVSRFSSFRFDFQFAGGASVIRAFYEVPLEPARLRALRVREGRRMDLFKPEEALDPARKVAPYDAFAVWLHASRKRLEFGEDRHPKTSSRGRRGSRDEPAQSIEPAQSRPRGARNNEQGRATMRPADTPISIAAYDMNEADAVGHFGGDILSARTPITFLANGYPTRVGTEQELLRYVDPRKETFSRVVDDTDQFLRQYSLRTRFTKDEMQIMQRIREKTARFCQENFRRRVVPINSLMSAVGLFRAIKHAQASFDRPLSVVEIGPGAGYLGALLIASGHPYVAVEATQSLYLWQSRFLHHFVPRGGFQEQAHATVGEPVRQSAATHVPWWHFVSNIGKTPLRADIVICDQALSEMHPSAARYAIFTARDILSRSDARLFMFSDLGQPTVPHDQVLATFAEAQYSRILSHCLYAFTPGTHQLPEAVYALDTDVPLYNPSADDQLFRPSSVLKTKRAELPPDMEFRRFVNIWPHYDLFVSDGPAAAKRPRKMEKATKAAAE